MARYIDADKLKEAFSTDTQHLYTFDPDLYDLIVLDIDEAPTADVVPKSEVDRLNAVMKEMDEQRAYTINMLGENLENAKAEVEALKIANEKMYSAIEETKREVIEEYRQRVNTKMGKHTHLLGKEYVQRILREVAKELKNEQG